MTPYPQYPVSVLIVDENEISRSTISRFVENKLPGVALHIANNCKAGVELCKRHKIDMVITDIKAPSQQCHDIVGTIKQINNDAEFILITSSSDDRMFNSTFKALDVSFIHMPVDLQELLKVTKANIAKIESKHNGATKKIPRYGDQTIRQQPLPVQLRAAAVVLNRLTRMTPNQDNGTSGLWFRRWLRNQIKDAINFLPD